MLEADPARNRPTMADTIPTPVDLLRAALRPSRPRGGLGRRSFVALLGGAALAAGGLPEAGAREGVEVGAAVAALQARVGRAGRAGRGAAVQRNARPGGAEARARAGQPSAGRAPALHRRSASFPHTYEWNPRAREWNWEVNLIGSKQINAFCMPGGKIAFFYGILDQLQAQRRRGGDDHGPRDDPRAARACARADGQDHGDARRDRDRLGAPRPRQRRAAASPTWAASC